MGKIEFLAGNHIRYNMGNGLLACHIDAVHAAPPNSDKYTGDLVEIVVQRLGCAGIIASVSRQQADLNRSENDSNREAVREYRSVIRRILLKLGILDEQNHCLTRPYLHLGIHGMRDQIHGRAAMEIGTINGRTCSPEIETRFVSSLKHWGDKFLPVLDLKVNCFYSGDRSLVQHREGYGDYPGYGPNYNVIQLEISRGLREGYLNQLAEVLSRILLEFDILGNRPLPAPDQPGSALCDHQGWSAETRLPFPQAYWVLPDRLLAGEYPGNKEDRCAYQKLASLMDCGVRRIIDLTEPGELRQYQPVLEQLVKDRGRDLIAERFPIPDLGLADEGSMRVILDRIDHWLEADLPVYVHCWGGHGRTGMVIGCFLARHGLAVGEQALDYIKTLRSGTPDSWRRSPETEEQRRLVRCWQPGK